MANFWERAAGIDGGSSELLDLPFFELCLQLYAADVVPASIFERSELSLTLAQQQELTDLLALMPAGQNDRTTWRARVVACFQGARIQLEQLDTVAKVQAALGVAA